MKVKKNISLKNLTVTEAVISNKISLKALMNYKNEGSLKFGNDSLKIV